MEGRRKGVRRVESFLRAKHGEESSYAGRRNKGESSGGFVSGERRETLGGDLDGNQGKVERLVTVFINNIPRRTSRRDLWWEFKRYGKIVDVYISWKKRKRSDGPFGFIRFVELAEARKAIEALNGAMWSGMRIQVSISKFARKEASQNRNIVGQRKEILEESREGGKGKNDDAKPGRSNKKVVETMVPEEQKQLVERSLIGESFNSIDLGRITQILKEEWTGPGLIACRDMEPNKCLISLESVEFREMALNNSLLLSLFDEIRPYWGSGRSRTRRV
ncbi:Serine arginine-rich splicing factor 2 [Stylosanthes scabra]|uniref:Serine arginine-rich splicing factor 2 n=1 Tax=Stylosanthes scabra TaxID=79078 RepID=A0ABU6YAH9_9FABA|nr:Serine arginine-rich splicing factor 2 [Stylosanthes scabra]